MSLKSVLEYLKKRAADTPDTSEKITGYQPKAPIHAGCTPDTPDTPHLSDTPAIAQTGQPGEAANDPAAPELQSQPAAAPPEPPVPAKPKKQTFMEWQDTWRELDRAYQLHHFNCPFCIAAGKGYGLRCGTGAALYTAYTDATQRTTP